MTEKQDAIEIDVIQILQVLWKRIWAIILAMLIFGGVAFSCTYYLVTPLYQSSVKMYVNNSSISVGTTSFSISSSELSAAQSLVDTYIVILNTRMVLNEVISEADLPYTFEQLNQMVSASAVNNTEVFEIVVTDKNSEEAKLIANTIADVLPEKISNIVEGSSVNVVDYAVLATQSSYPNYTSKTMLGVLIGLVLSVAVIVIKELSDKVVRTEDYLMQVYNIPLLAVIPNMGSAKKAGGK